MNWKQSAPLRWIEKILHWRKLPTVLLILLFLVGLGLILYPSVSNYWNLHHQSQAIAGYQEAVGSLDEDENEKMLKAAKEYNRSLASGESDFKDVDPDDPLYNSLLDAAGNGIMGWIEIPAIDCSLPVYHGTSDPVLQVGAGHIQGSSLPVGGKSTHCVLSGHRGLPSAQLFTRLDKMKTGDVFLLHVLNQVFTYRVDRIRIVLPEDTSELTIRSGQDLCTLVTCTPYGINTHRLLVRGHRIKNQTDGVYVDFDANRVSPSLISAVLIVPLLVLLFFLLSIWTRKNPELYLLKKLEERGWNFGSKFFRRFRKK